MKTVKTGASKTGSDADTGFRERGGVGCRGYRYFILGHFVAGHITRCMDNILLDASQNCKGGQNAGHFMEQGGQNANIIKTFYI